MNSEVGISIITIVLNGELYIEETVKSVINQDLENLEYIIIDGGSTDQTLQLLSQFGRKICKIVSGYDGGIYPAINKGISLCTRELVGIIHCGDILVPGALNSVYHKYIETAADVIYGDIIILEENGMEFIARNYIANHLHLKERMSIFHPAAFVKLSLYRSIGLYNSSFKIAATMIYSCIYFSQDIILSMFRNTWQSLEKEEFLLLSFF